MELIFSIAEEGVGLHTICNRLRKAKVMKPSFYKKELFERFVYEDTPKAIGSIRYIRLPDQTMELLAEFSKRHGLPHINSHVFRHTQASMLFFDGIESVSISHCVADMILKPAKAKLRVVGD